MEGGGGGAGKVSKGEQKLYPILRGGGGAQQMLDLGFNIFVDPLSVTNAQSLTSGVHAASSRRGVEFPPFAGRPSNNIRNDSDVGESCITLVTMATVKWTTSI